MSKKPCFSQFFLQFGIGIELAILKWHRKSFTPQFERKGSAMKYTKIILVIAAVAVMSVPSMAEAQNYTQRGTRNGAIAGAIIGGVVGDQRGNAFTGAVIGGLVGGAAGRAIGHSRDARFYGGPPVHGGNQFFGGGPQFGHSNFIPQQNFHGVGGFGPNVNVLPIHRGYGGFGGSTCPNSQFHGGHFGQGHGGGFYHPRW